jgi:hypothetical protein
MSDMKFSSRGRVGPDHFLALGPLLQDATRHTNGERQATTHIMGLHRSLNCSESLLVNHTPRSKQLSDGTSLILSTLVSFCHYITRADPWNLFSPSDKAYIASAANLDKLAP